MQNKELYTDIATNFLKDNEGFGNLKTELGSGYNGTAFLTDKGFVVKITKDKEEYSATLKIFNQINGKYTPMYYKVEPHEGLYVILMDYVEPIKLSSEESDFLNMFRDGMLSILEDGGDISYLKKTVSKIENKKLEFIIRGLIDCVIGLSKIGIINTDIQEDNIGILNDKVVLFDVAEEGVGQLTESKRAIRSIVREIVGDLI